MYSGGDRGEDERAVSPVIGVILTVAITVILAAVIGVFVLNLGGGVNENVKAGASVSATDSHGVRVTWNSNQNANVLDVEITSSDCGVIDGERTSLNSVGSSFTSSGTCDSGDMVSVIVTAIGNGDAKSVVFNDDVEV